MRQLLHFHIAFKILFTAVYILCFLFSFGFDHLHSWRWQFGKPSVIKHGQKISNPCRNRPTSHSENVPILKQTHLSYFFPNIEYLSSSPARFYKFRSLRRHGQFRREECCSVKVQSVLQQNVTLFDGCQGYPDYHRRRS